MFPFYQIIDGWFKNYFHVEEAKSQIRSLEQYRENLRGLEDKSVATSARLSHLLIRRKRSSKHLFKQKCIAMIRALFVLIVSNVLALSFILMPKGVSTEQNIQLIILFFSVISGFSIATLLYIIAPPPKRRTSSLHSTALGKSPKMRIAEFLLWLLLPREGREAAIGDTNETFEMMTELFGARKARFWYWSEVAKSAWPMLCYLGRQLGKWCGIGAVAEFLRRAL